MSDPALSWEPCADMFRYSELAARSVVVLRNHRDGGLHHWAVGCRDHWHVIDKRSNR